MDIVLEKLKRMQKQRLCNIYKILSKSKSVKNGLIFSVFSFFNKGIAFFLLILLARYITPNDYGELNLFNTVVMFLGYIVGLSTSGYFSVSFFKSNSKLQLCEDFTAICIITVTFSFCIVLLFSVFRDFFSELLKIQILHLFMGVAISFADVFILLLLDFLRVQEKILKYGLISCSFAGLNLLVTIYLVVFADLNWEGRVYAQLLCNLLYMVIAIGWLYKYRLFCMPKCLDVYKKIILWSLPLIPHSASGWIKIGLDRYIIENTHSMADVGLFSFAMNIAGVMIMVGVAFNQTNSVNLYQTLSSDMSLADKYNSLRKKEKYFAIIYTIVAVLILIGGVVLITLIMPQYSESIPYFLILTVYGLLQCFYLLECNYLFYFGKLRNLMYYTFGLSIVHLVLSLLLTRFSLYFTCFIYCISQLLLTVSIFCLSERVKRKYLFP